MYSAGDVVVVEFPGVTGIKRRPAVALSSDLYHETRPDIIIGLVTSQAVSSLAPSDYALENWREAGLRVPSLFRASLVTIPRANAIRRIGHLSDRDWKGDCDCVKAALA